MLNSGSGSACDEYETQYTNYDQNQFTYPKVWISPGVRLNLPISQLPRQIRKGIDKQDQSVETASLSTQLS